MMLSKMDMEGSIGNNEHLTKGKRTKRGIRMLSPCTVVNTTVTSSCSSVIEGGGRSFSSTTFDSTEEEEEADMANCLILLAQGRTGGQENHHLSEHHQQVGGYNNIVTEKPTRNGFESYECKTCNRFFHSFQALGGHRASHKKPKMKEITTAGGFEEENNHFHNKNVSLVPPVSLELRCGGNLNFHGHGNNNKPNRSNKVHECSICGAEFTSGQALGGHMRRHRACTNKNNNNNVGDVHVKSRNVLELDLNLPAPEEDLRDSTFQFPAMVGCHY
ncbi:zinc finger protein ZAT5-like [Vicia villosa]|uniref:zinc finger protein ZAT5-like n=1 Tax=Vicia villosa TaxID=3911 RepID=UPI00273AAD5B|nr:zinc finger protein ZAT5-like [Vicia villosa]